MEILIRGDKIKVTDAIKNYVEGKISKLDKYFDDPASIKGNAIIRVKDNNQIIEITIPTNKFTLRAEEKNDDLYAAIDLVVDKLERQIRKNKTKLQSKKIKEKMSKSFMLEAIESEDDDNEGKIVKRKKVEVKPMSEEEAILQMELLEHQFYIFKDSETDKIAVVYQRKEGNYGIIESE